MSSFIPLGIAVVFNATSSGAGSFVVASAYSTFATPEQSNVVNGKVYKYYAQSSDGSQWEYGFGTYNTSTHTLARTTISQTSNNDQVTVGFTTIPIVSVFPTAVASLEANSVLRAGDTMTGDLSIAKATPSIVINKTASGQDAAILGALNGVSRWAVLYGNSTAESGSNVGGDFSIYRYNDAGAFAGEALNINRATGALNVNAGIYSSQSSITGTYAFGSAGTKYLNCDGTNFNFVGGPLVINSGNVTAGSGGALATYFFGNTGTNYLSFDGTKFVLNGGPLAAFGSLCRTGVGGSFGGNSFNTFWTGAVLQGWVDNTNLGNFAFTSDYRTKKDVTALPTMWDTVKGLRPIKYTQRDFDPLFVADEVERWGFLAHELQETLTTSAASGVKDAPNTIQSPNPFTVIAALTKALQEAMARIERLEALP